MDNAYHHLHVRKLHRLGSDEHSYVLLNHRVGTAGEKIAQKRDHLPVKLSHQSK